MFTEQPELAVRILRDHMGVPLPDTPLVRQEERTFNTRSSDDFDADVVLSLGPHTSPLHAVIIEVQQDKSKEPKQLSRYAAALWLLMKCDVTVLIVCPDRAAAKYYAQPIDSGLTGYQLQAQVLGPDDIPVITDATQAAANMALAVMSVMVHGKQRKVVEAFTTALNDTATDYASKYTEYAYSMSSFEIRCLLEELMASTSWPVYSPFAREHYGRGLEEGKAEGKAEGQAEGKAREAAKLVLLFLSARGLDVTEDVRARITDCTDVETLEAWAVRAATVQTADELFDESGQ